MGAGAKLPLLMHGKGPGRVSCFSEGDCDLTWRDHLGLEGNLIGRDHSLLIRRRGMGAKGRTKGEVLALRGEVEEGLVP